MSSKGGSQIVTHLIGILETIKLIEIMNNEMKQVDIWLQANGLVINQEKTHYMVFHRARIKTNSNE